MGEHPVISQKRPRFWGGGVKGAVTLLVLGVYALSFWQTGTNPKALIEGLPQMGEFIWKMVPPNFIDWQAPYFYNVESDLPGIFDKAVQTVQMAVMGTVFAVIGGLMLSFIAARNINPNPFVYQAARFTCDALRGISELVWALLFVAMVGLGPFAGVLALTVHSIGALGKYFSEAIETIDAEVIESVQSSGAGRVQVYAHGVFPELRPLFMSYILYYFEHNLRQATVLGVVGAGGIGLELLLSIQYFNFDKVLTVVMVMLAMVIATDRLSGVIRKRLVGGEILVVT